MRVLFCYDGPLRKDSENNYYGIGLNDKAFKRYEKISQDINIAIRVSKMDKNMKKQNLLKISYNVIELPSISSLKGLLFNYKKCYEILKEEIKKSDLIIIRMPSIIGNLAFKIVKKYNKKSLIEMVGCPWDALWNHSVKGKIIAPFMWYKTKRNLKKAENVVYVTSDFLQRRYPTLGKNIACSDVELKAINEETLNEKINEIQAEKENKKIILGTLAAIDVKYKGQADVIKAIAILKNEGYNFEYQLVGAGKKEKLERLAQKLEIKDRVKFLGSKPHDEVFKWLDNIDIYIQPSKQEGLPRALIESMSRGCPCIGSNVGGIPELLQPNCIYKKGNYKELITLLKKFDTTERVKQSKINFEKAKEFSKQKLEKVFECFIESI